MTHRVHVRSTHFQEGAGPVPVTRLLWFHIFSREVFSLCLTSWRGSAGWLAGVDQPSDRTALRPHARGRGHKFTSPPSSFCKAQPPLPMISESFLLSFIVPHALRSSSSHHLWSAHQHQIFHPPFSGGGFLPLYLASLCLRMLPQSASPKQTNPTSSYVEAQTVDTEPAFGLKFPVFIPLVSGENVCFICCLCVSAEHKQWLLFDPLSDLEYIRDPPTQPSAPPRGRSVLGRGTSAVIDVHNPPAARPLQTQNPAVLKKTMCSRAAKRNPSAGRRGRRARCSAGLWGLPGFHIREER